ncbi:hypothetical protein D3C71_1638550 [compost metagenome]
MNRFHIQRVLNMIGVVQQTVIGRVGDYRMHWPGRVWCFFNTFGDGVTGKLTLRDTTENAVSITGWAEVDWRNIAHHHQMGQRFVAVTVNQYGAAGRCGVHADNFVGGRSTVSHHIAAFSVEYAGNILFSFFVRTGVVQQ